MIFYSIFNFDPTIVIMKASKLSLNPTDVSYRNGVETCHVKILNGQNTNTLYHITVKSFNRILYHNPGLSIKERHYFILRPYLATIFISLINAHVKTLATLFKLRQNQSANKLLSWRYYSIQQPWKLKSLSEKAW